MLWFSCHFKVFGQSRQTYHLICFPSQQSCSFFLFCFAEYVWLPSRTSVRGTLNCFAPLGWPHSPTTLQEHCMTNEGWTDDINTLCVISGGRKQLNHNTDLHITPRVPTWGPIPWPACIPRAADDHKCPGKVRIRSQLPRPPCTSQDLSPQKGSREALLAWDKAAPRWPQASLLFHAEDGIVLLDELTQEWTSRKH